MNAISIRGISSSAGAGTTGIYIDDTPIQMRDIGFNPDDTLPRTFDLERVEALRGPQGTLFGAGSEGGTVRYILTPPSVSQASTSDRTDLSYTYYGQPSYEAGVARGQPLIDGILGIRASAWYQSIGGWINQVDPTTDARASLQRQPRPGPGAAAGGGVATTDSLQITPSISTKARRSTTRTPTGRRLQPLSRESNTAMPELMRVPDQHYLGALKLEQDFATTSLISDTSDHHRHEMSAYQGTVYDLSLFQGLGRPDNPAMVGLGAAPPRRPRRRLARGTRSSTATASICRQASRTTRRRMS